MIKLRDYQEQCLNEIRREVRKNNNRVVLCAPTGAGKTIMFTAMVQSHLAKGGRALILTDRVELLKQANGAFAKFGLDPEDIKAGYKPDLSKNCHVAMVETLHRRAEKYSTFLNSRTLVIIDEAHRTAFNKLFQYFSNSCVVIGATATPYRKGNQPSMDESYQAIVQPVDTPDLIDKGFLSNAKSYGVDIDLKGVKKKGGDYDTGEMAERFSENKVYAGVIENYNRITPGQKAIAFASNIESSKELTAKMVAAGLPAKHLDSGMSKTEREEILDWFDKSPNGILCNIGILTTGFDQPDIKVVILYRATTSLPLFLQMVGRGSRVCDGKDGFTILDFGNNIKKHNFWESYREWGLQKEARRKEQASSVKNCPKCDALVTISTSICGYCGYEWKKTPKQKEEEEMARLVLLSKPDRLKLGKNASLEEKAKFAKAGVIKAAWVLHNLSTREEALRFIKLMGYKRGWLYHNEKRFAVFRK